MPDPDHKPVRTWGEFKAAIESQGVSDNTKLGYIDWDQTYHEPPTVRLSDGRATIE